MTSASSSEPEDPPHLCAPLLQFGKCWEELPVGFSFRTAGRTLSEADLVHFVGMYGFNDSLFFDTTALADMGHERRLVPAALTYTIAEGLLMQTRVLEGTGIAFLAMSLDVNAPVYVGDTLHVTVAITDVRPTSKHNSAVVTSMNQVINQHDLVVLTYRPVRLTRGLGG